MLMKVLFELHSILKRFVYNEIQLLRGPPSVIFTTTICFLYGVGLLWYLPLKEFTFYYYL